MNFIKVLGFICFLTVNILAQGNYSDIKGTVIDAQGKAIKGAKVLLTSESYKDVNRTTETDENGHFVFRVQSVGYYTVTASYTENGVTKNSAPAKVAYSLDRDVPWVTLQIDENSTIREEVTVNISADTEQKIEQVSKTVNIIDSQEMRDRADFSLVETLRTIPGFRVQQLGGFGRTASIKTRGLRNQDTAVLVDGVRFRDASTITGDASPFLSDFTLTSVSRIEVLRGSGSSLYGTNAIGGVIDFQTPRPTNGWHGQIGGAFGGLGLGRFRGNTSYGADKFGFNVGVSRTVYTKGIDNDDDANNTNFQTRIEYNPFTKTNISARFFVSDAFVKLNSNPDTFGTLPASTATIINANEGVNFTADVNDPDNFQKSKFFNGQLVVTQVITNRLSFQGYYSGLQTSRKNVNGGLGIGFQPFDGDENYIFKGQIHTASGVFNWNPFKGNQAKFGYEYEWEKFGNDGVFATAANNFEIRARQTSNTFYVQDLQGFLNNRLQISGAFRAQWFALKNPAFSNGGTPTAFTNLESPPTAYTGDGAVSYFYERTGTKFRAHLGNGYRVPSLYERFGSYYFLNTFFVLGNPDLKPERSLAFDFGIEQNLFKNRARLSATYFYTEINDEISYLPTDDLGAPSYYNFDKHFSRGIELSADVKPTKSTDVFASYTFTNSDIRNFRRQTILPPFNIVSQDRTAFGIPNHQFTLVATQRYKDFWINADFVASSSYLAPVFSNTTFSTYTYRFRGNRRADLTAGYTFKMRNDQLSLRLFGTIENLFDYEYYENGFQTVGRNGRLGLSFGF